MVQKGEENIGGRSQANSVGKSAVCQFIRGGSMPESYPISAICAQIVGIQGMSGLWGSNHACILVGLFVAAARRPFFATAHFPPYFVNIPNIVSQVCPYSTIHTEYSVSILSIYYYVSCVMSFCAIVHRPIV